MSTTAKQRALNHLKNTGIVTMISDTDYSENYLNYEPRKSTVRIKIAECFSENCERLKRFKKIPQVKKDAKGAWCPDCGNALFWSVKRQ